MYMKTTTISISILFLWKNVFAVWQKIRGVLILKADALYYQIAVFFSHMNLHPLVRVCVPCKHWYIDLYTGYGRKVCSKPRGSANQEKYTIEFRPPTDSFGIACN